MKKVIRNNVFESNSSSTHAICVCTDEYPLNVPKTLYFGIGEHGWEVETLSTPEEKANYLYTAVLKLYEKEQSEEKVQELYRVLEDYGCEAEFAEPIWNEWNDGSYWLDYGYVDHVDELQEFVDSLFNNNELLLQYLFSDKSFVNKGNDNDYYDVEFTVDYPHEEFYKGN